MMPAAKHFDPILGIDIHIILIPTPAGPVPTPIPHPFVGMLIDPMDYAPFIGATVKVNGLPRAQAGTAGKCLPPHIPMGGPFMKPPGNECEMFMGSTSVLADGEVMSYLALPALSCQDIGMPPPPRVKASKTHSLTLPTTLVTPIPAGGPVLVGGAPTISLMGIAMKLGMAGLMKGFKKLAKTKAFKRLMAAAKKKKAAMFKNMKPGFLKCMVLKAEPVDVRTGEVVVDQLDFTLDWPLPIEWTRNYRSSRRRSGVCGVGWETLADARLELGADGAVAFHHGNGIVSYFERLPDSGFVLEPIDGGKLELMGNGLAVKLKDGRSFHFTRPEYYVRELAVQWISDRCDREMRFTRGAEGLSEIASGSGLRIHVHSAGGRIRRMTLFHPAHTGGHPLVRYDYDDVGDLRVVRDALEHGYRFAYDRHCLVQHTNRNGLSFHYVYDLVAPEGRVLHAWGDGGLYDTTFEYDDDVDRRLITDSVGALTTIQLGDLGLPMHEIDALGGMTAYEYDTEGRGSAVVAATSARTSFTYDARGNLLRCVRADDTVIEYDWNDDDRLVSVRDPRGGVWRQEWDVRGLLRAKIDPAGNAHRFEYDERGLVHAEIDARGSMTRYVRDSFGRVVERVDRIGRRTRYDYDALGQVVAVMQPDGARVDVERDAKGRLRRLRAPSGSVHELEYDAEDEVVLERDAEGHVLRYEHFGLGEVARRIESDGTIWTYEHDTEERLVAVIDPLGRRTTLERDILGRIVAERDPWGNATRYEHGADRTIRVFDPLGQSLVFRLDALGRVMHAAASNGSAWSYEYDANGNLIAASSPAAALGRRYDAQNRVVEESAGDVWVRSEYDASGNRVRRASSLGHVIDFHFDAEDEIHDIDVDGRERIRYERDGAGRVRNEAVSDAVRVAIEYDRDGQIVGSTIESRGASVASMRYAYDRRGCLIQRTEGAGFGEILERDPLGRVRRVRSSSGAIWIGDYDVAGSLLHDAGIHTDQGGTRDAVGRGVQCTFDAAGNVVERRTNRGVQRLTWDGEGRLARVADATGAAIGLHYDALGRRVEKTGDVARAQYAWDDATQWLRVENGERCELVHAPESFEPVMLLLENGEVLFFHCEPNGAARALFDEAGNVLWTCRYTPTGEATILTGEEHDPLVRLQGQHFDTETGLTYNGERYFDPLITRFVSPDPIGFEGGDDLYEYGLSIWEWIDPLGLSCKPKRKQVFKQFPSRKRAMDARPRPKPQKPKAEGGKRTTRQSKNKIGTGNNPDPSNKPEHPPHFHDDAHVDPTKPNVHYSFPK